MDFKLISLSTILIAALCFTPLASAKPYGQYLCKTEGYECLRVKRNQSWKSLFPDEHERDIVMRINRLNIQLYAGMVLAVPNNLNGVDAIDFSPFPRQIEAPGEKVVMVDPANNAWAAYAKDGTQLRWGPMSGGAEYCRDTHRACETHEGTYRVYSLGSSDCISHKFPLPKGGAPMPYCMYFNNGQALHGEPNGLPGYNASHGCVRLYVNDAEWLRYDFVEGPNEGNNFRGTKVMIGAYAEPEEGLVHDLK
jgi:hypothetical protein